MRTVHFRTLAFAAAAGLSLAGSVGAQDTPSGLLNTLEVRELVARGEPDDHVRLSAHFLILAGRDSAQAKRHTSMSQTFVANPNRRLGTGMSGHCRRLADLNTQTATTLRELAAYHDELAGGRRAVPPAGGSRFEGGAGAPAPTEQDLDVLAAKAGTPADHRVLHEYFLTLATRYTAEANDHDALAQAHRGTRLAQMVRHHDRLAGLSREAATEATDAAEMHRELAAIAW